MRLIVVLCLMTSGLFSSGCARATPPPSTWVEPIVFQPETIRWLESLEWPQTAYEDFDKIRKFNIKCQEILGIKVQTP